MSSASQPLLRYYKGPMLLTPVITDDAIDAVKTFKYRDDDIIIATYPKCGTHWMNEVVQLMIHDGDPTKLDHRHRRPPLEVKDSPDFSKMDEVKAGVELVVSNPSPRVLTTHLVPSYLSEETWEKRIPIIYVFRDPRDVALSYYNFLKIGRLREGEPFMQSKTFEQYLPDYIKGNIMYSGWCEHALSFEDRWRKGENILFTYYEDMKQDLPRVIKTIAKHINRPVSDDVVHKIVANSTVDAMRRNYAEATKKKEGGVDLSVFVKTGVAGKWKTDHPEDQWRELNQVFKEKVKESELAKRYFD